MTPYSSESTSVVSGTARSASKRVPRWTRSVASPPSSRSMFGPTTSPLSSRNSNSRWVHHQYSSSVSPFQAKTGPPAGASGVPSPTTIAAAAWSWVEKMLQLAQRTSAPSAVSVSISTPVWIVMCSEPVTRAPFSGCSAPYFSRSAMRPGISCWASSSSLRPNSASERSATLKSTLGAVSGGRVVICLLGRVLGIESLCRVGEREQALVLLLLPAQPVRGGDALRPPGRCVEPAVERVAQLAVLAQPLGERDVGEAAVEALEQLLQGAQALELLRTEDAVAGARAGRLDQADALEVAEHSRRPACGLRRLVDRQGAGHRPTTLTEVCQGLERAALTRSIASIGVGST